MVQLNLLVGSWFATHLPAGTVSYLFYADRLVQLPLGIVGVALGTALLPALSLAVRERPGRARGAEPRRWSSRCCWRCRRRSGLVLLAQPIVPCPVRAWRLRRRRDARRPRRCWPGWRWACRPMSWPRSWRRASSPARTRRTPVKVAAVALVVNVAIARRAHRRRWAMSASRWRCRCRAGSTRWAWRVCSGAAGSCGPTRSCSGVGAGILAAVAVMAVALLAAAAPLSAWTPAPVGLALLIGLAAVSPTSPRPGARVPSTCARSGGCGAPPRA